MEILKITKGNYIEQEYRSYSGAITIRVIREGFNDVPEDVLTINGYQRTKNEIEGTFKVVLDSLNTYNKTPILPSELLKINEELVEMLEFANKALKAVSSFGATKPIIERIENAIQNYKQ